MEAMVFHGIPWNPMEVDGAPWNSMDPQEKDIGARTLFGIDFNGFPS